jgi:GTP cyclohydrolase I
LLYVEEVVGSAIFTEPMVRDVEIASLCEHHMLPFTGKVSSMLSLPSRDCVVIMVVSP